MEYSPSIILGIALLIGLIFGIVGQITDFCFYRGLKERWHSSSGHQLQSFTLALATALVGTQLIAARGWVDLSQSIYLNPTLSWLLLPLGGVLFGYGMALANGCGARALVLLGQGNLRSLVVLLCLGISALMTLTGLLAPLRLHLAQLSTLHLTHTSLIQGDFRLMGTVLVTTLLVGYTFTAPKNPNRQRDFIGATLIGLLVVTAWLTTGWLGADPFDPMPISSLSFVVPVGETLQYAMLATGMKLKFAVLVVIGLILGSTVSAIVNKKYNFTGFDSLNQLIRSIQGGCLMGVGGVLGMGCTIGQGLSGLSTLAYGSLVTLLCITLGAWLHDRRPQKSH